MPPPPLTAVAHDLRSLHNVGAIFRTCDGAGFARVVLSGHTGFPPDARIAKVALGAEETVPWVRAETLAGLFELLRDAFVVVLEQHPRSVPPTALELPAGREIALVACGELFGAPPELLERADAVLELPMRGDKESLNVSVAFGVAAYAVASAVHGDEGAALASRRTPRPVRDGVLTRGPTCGEVPAR